MLERTRSGAAAPLPEDPAARIEVQAIRVELASIDMQIKLSQYDAARQQLDDIEARVRASRDGPTLADLLAHRARITEKHFEYRRAVDLYAQSSRVARASAHWRTAASSKVWESFISIYHLQDSNYPFEDAMRDLDAWIDATGSPPELLRLRDRTYGVFLFVRGDAQGALPHFYRAYSYVESIPTLKPQQAQALDDLVITLSHLGRTREA